MYQVTKVDRWYQLGEVPAPPPSFVTHEQNGQIEYLHNGRHGRKYTYHVNPASGQPGYLVEHIQLQGPSCCGN